MAPHQEKEINTLRREVIIQLACHGLSGRGKKAQLANELSERTGRQVSYQSLVMALSGFRATEAYRQILTDLKMMLEGQENSCGENIHVNDNLQ